MLYENCYNKEKTTGKPFRIVKAELKFYRQHKLPLPHQHPDQRHLERMQLRTPRKLRERTCANCGKSIQTTYAPDRPEIVYCSECYEKEIYG
jgi:CxxC-x17-CxxC domain-containing protein